MLKMNSKKDKLRIFINAVHDLKPTSAAFENGSQPQMRTEEIEYYFPHFVRLFIQVGYYLMIIPFKVECGFHSQTTIHKIICKVLAGALFLSFILQLRVLTTNDILKDPPKTFYNANIFIVNVTAVAFLYMVWTKQKETVAVANIYCKKPKNRISTVVIYLIVFFQWTIPFFLALYDEINTSRRNGFGHQNQTLSTSFVHRLRRFLPFIPRCQAVVPWWIAFLAHFLAIINFVRQFLVHVGTSFNFVACFAVYEIWTKCHHEQNKWDTSLGDKFHQFLKCSEVSEKVSQMFRTLSFWSFINASSWAVLSPSAFIIEQKGTWESLRLFSFSYQVGLMFIFFVAAEGHLRGEKCKQHLLAIWKPQHEMETFSDFTQFMNEKQIALAGGHYFPITYGFIGATISVVLTHILVMLQFNAPTICKCTVGFPNVGSTQRPMKGDLELYPRGAGMP